MANSLNRTELNGLRASVPDEILEISEVADSVITSVRGQISDCILACRGTFDQCVRSCQDSIAGALAGVRTTLDGTRYAARLAIDDTLSSVESETSRLLDSNIVTSQSGIFAPLVSADPEPPMPPSDPPGPPPPPGTFCFHDPAIRPTWPLAPVLDAMIEWDVETGSWVFRRRAFPKLFDFSRIRPYWVQYPMYINTDNTFVPWTGRFTRLPRDYDHVVIRGAGTLYGVCVFRLPFSQVGPPGPPPPRPPQSRLGRELPPPSPPVPPPPPPPPPPGGYEPCPDPSELEVCYPLERRKISEGCVPLPRVIRYWTAVNCIDQCNICWECWEGDCPPPYRPGWTIYGPSERCLDTSILWQLGCIPPQPPTPPPPPPVDIDRPDIQRPPPPPPIDIDDPPEVVCPAFTAHEPRWESLSPMCVNEAEWLEPALGLVAQTSDIGDLNGRLLESHTGEMLEDFMAQYRG